MNAEPGGLDRCEDGVAREAQFVAETGGHRRMLLAHCYRMLGAAGEAEDAVQETYLRAWRAWDGFQRRASVGHWLYRIATNVCLSLLEGRPRRALPAGLGGPGQDPSTLVAEDHDVLWIEPMPDPAVVADSGARLRLALIASLQHLPPRPRAVLILRDVLGWRIDEVAEALAMTRPAARSALQRARARLSVSPYDEDDLLEPNHPEARRLLDGYIAAFEQSDIAALSALLRDDATLQAARSRTWFAGKTACLQYIAHYMSTPGEWRLLPISANGQPAAGAYRNGERFAVAVLGITRDGISTITLFTDTGLFDRFELPTYAARLAPPD